MYFLVRWFCRVLVGIQARLVSSGSHKGKLRQNAAGIFQFHWSFAWVEKTIKIGITISFLFAIAFIKKTNLGDVRYYFTHFTLNIKSRLAIMRTSWKTDFRSRDNLRNLDNLVLSTENGIPFALTKGNVSFETLYGGQFTLSTQLINQIILLHSSADHWHFL